MKIKTIQLLMTVKDSFLEKIKKGRRGTFTWNNIEVDVPEYTIAQEELSSTGTAKIGHVVIPAQKVRVHIEVNVDRTKGKSNKRRN